MKTKRQAADPCTGVRTLRGVFLYDASLDATPALLDRYRMSDARARHLGE